MRYNNINIFGIGNVGLNICNLLIYEGLSKNINLITNQDKKYINAVKLDFINAKPYTNHLTNIYSYSYNEFPEAEINIICGGAKPKKDEKRIDLIERNKSYLDLIIDKELKGDWIIITNPDDFLAKYILKNSNLKANQITALGITLDNMRGANRKISNKIYGQHNEDIYTKEKDNLKEIVRIPWEIVENKGYTKFGIGYIVLWYLKYKLNYQGNIISKYDNLENKFKSKEINYANYK